MAAIYTRVEELIGRTPLFEPAALERELGLRARVLVKLEFFNPAGSVKDRAALSMILDAEEKAAVTGGGPHLMTPNSHHLLAQAPS